MQWKQRQGIVCASQQIYVAADWFNVEVVDFYLVHQYSGPAFLVPKL